MTPTLNDYISSKTQVPFAWGKHDCVTFSVGWACLQSGRNYLEGIKPWKSKRQALREIAKEGTLENYVTKRFGAPIAGYPKDGDLALLPDAIGGLCIVYGPYAVGPSTEIGLGFLPFTQALKYWSVPCQV